MNRGRWLRGLGPKWDFAAIACFRQAMRARPAAIDPLLDIAETYFRNRQWWRARRWYVRIVRQRPDCFEAWRKGADCLPRDANMRRACWLLRAYELSPGDMDVLNNLTYHLAQLNGWRRWRIYRAFWRIYDAVWPAVQKAKSPYGWWRLPFVAVSRDWERFIGEWAQNKRAGMMPFTGSKQAKRMEDAGGMWPC